VSPNLSAHSLRTKRPLHILYMSSKTPVQQQEL